MAENDVSTSPGKVSQTLNPSQNDQNDSEVMAAGSSPEVLFPTRDMLARSILTPITESLHRAGLTPDHIAVTLMTASKADKVVTASHEGIIKDEKFYPDHRMRVEAVMSGAKLQGLLVDRKELDIRKQTIVYLSGIKREPLPE